MHTLAQIIHGFYVATAPRVRQLGQRMERSNAGTLDSMSRSEERPRRETACRWRLQQGAHAYSGLPLVPLLAVLLAAQPGCGANAGAFGRLGRWLTGRSSQPSSPAPTRPTLTDLDGDELPWARNEEFFIVISRSCRTLDVFRWGHRIRRYPAVFGMNPRGAKLYEGDLRTPTGFYAIIEKRRHPRWARFLLIDYPNATDADRYAKAVEAGTLPEGEDGLPGIGKNVGIHGSDKEELNNQDIDWTWGCISLSNRDVVDLDSLVPVGTPVLIVE
jgi:hypothetical protein